MKARIVALLGFSAFSLSACAGIGATPDPVAIGSRPDNYREIVRARIHAEFFDPYTMQDVSISEPFPGRLFFKDGWMVCLRANAKNRMGGYTGLQETGYLINNGQVIEEGDQAGCPNATYSAWPEMDNAGH